MVRLLVNNIEQVQPQDHDGTLFHLHCRDESGEYRQVEVHGFRPYFYVLEHEAKVSEDWYLAQESIEEIEYGEYDAFNIDEPLARIYTPYPQDTRDARELFDEHFAADVPFTRRFRIDAGVKDVVEVPDAERVHWREVNPVEPGSGGSNPGGNASKRPLQDVEPRVVTVDIEADDRDGFPEPRQDDILSIVAHDSYTDATHAWLYTEGRNFEEWFGVSAEAVEEDGLEALGLDDTLEENTFHLRPTQRRLLIDFACWVDDHNPDLITGWNSNDFDIPYLIKRMEAVGAEASRMSRDGWVGMSNRDEPRIKGTTCYDAMTVLQANDFTKRRSYRLDDVAKEELGEEKIEFDSAFYELWDDDPAKLIRYNKHDVDLTVRLTEKARIVKFRDALRRQVGVDFEDSYDNKDFVDMMVRRKLKEWGLVPPSRPAYGEEPDGDFEGAHVFDPYKGIAEDVVALDVASLYPYTMAMINASPETKVDPDYDGPVARGANGQHFALDQQGLFPALVDDAIGLKAEYKETLRAASGEEKEFWEIQYGTAKTITNSLYGVTGWVRFFLYDEDVAEAVTLTGQEVLQATAKYVEDKTGGYEVIYGDTDSVYVEMPHNHSAEWCIEKAATFSAELNSKIYPALAKEFGCEENLWEIEVEAYMERYFQAGKKKRYAYLATWKDGEYIDPKVTIAGFEYRRSDSARLTAELQADVFDAILYGNDDEIPGLIYEAAQEVTKENPDLEYIGIPSGLGQRIDPEHAGEDGYYAFSKHGNHPQGAHPRGCWNANHLVGTSFGKGDKPYRVYLQPTYFDELQREIDVICYEDPADIEALQPLPIDVNRMIDTIVVSPLDRITDAVGIDARAAVRGQEQTGLGAWT